MNKHISAVDCEKEVETINIAFSHIQNVLLQTPTLMLHNTNCKISVDVSNSLSLTKGCALIQVNLCSATKSSIRVANACSYVTFIKHVLYDSSTKSD